MNCWFCNHEVKDVYCEQQSCRSYYVTYVFFIKKQNGQVERNLFKVEFKATLWNDKYQARDYFISYKVNDKMIEIVERITPHLPDDYEGAGIPYQWNHVLKVPYTHYTLTPTNYKDKLPLLLAMI